VLWATADLFVAWDSRHSKPLKERFEQAANVPLRQTELSIALDNLKALQTKLFEQRTEADRLVAELEEKRKQSPKEREKGIAAEREQRLKMATAKVMIRSLNAETPGGMQRVADLTATTFEARRSAEIAFSDALDKFEMSNKVRVFALGLISSTVVALLIWLVCRSFHKAIGRGSTAFVFVPGFLFLTAMCLYHFVK
jgi:hypothetical protein